jgi:hypothetical protein
MKRFFGPVGPRTAALLIVLLYLLDRAPATGYLLPDYCVEDERWVRDGALTMVRAGSLDPGTRKYPGLLFELTAGVYYLLYAVANVRALHGFISPESAAWHRAHYAFGFVETVVLGRLLVIALGAVALWGWWRLYRRETDGFTGAVALLLLASAPAWLFTTQVLKNDVLVVLGVWLAVEAALRVLRRGARMDYLLAGAALGFCLAAKYHAVAIVPVLVAHRLREREATLLGAFRQPRWLMIFPAALAVLFVLSPYSLLDLAGTVRQGFIELAIQNRLDPLWRRSSEVWWQLPPLFQLAAALPLALGAPLYLLALGGAVLKLSPGEPRDAVIYSYPAALVLFMAAASNLGAPHLFVSAVPFGALLAARLVAPWFESERSWHRLAALIAVAVAAGANLVSFHNLTAAEQDVIRSATREMVATHRPGSRDVGLVPYYPNPDRAWPLTFYPQFILTPDALARERPDRILLHHTFYAAYLDNKELAADPAVAATLTAYLELRAGQAGYRETYRADYDPADPLLIFYRSLFPDLAVMRASIFTHEEKPR